MDDKNDVSANTQLREEIHKLILRAGKESDITVYQALGVLEIVKFDLIELLERSKKRE
jgi:hypothetical protein